MHLCITCYIQLSLAVLATSMQCPDSSQWKLASKGICNSSHSWFNCLYDENNMNYTQFCTDRPDYQRPGYKFIFRGNIDGKPCDEHKYQPFKFWTNSSSDCVFAKTNCTEEGQVVFTKGNSTSDRKCRCDYTSGYAFVSKPSNGCSCDPALEDCSCHLLSCQPLQVLTPDYTCIEKTMWSGDFVCPLIKDTSETERTGDRCHGLPLCTPMPFIDNRLRNQRKIGNPERAVPVTIFITLILILGMTCIFGKKLLNMFSNFIEKRFTIKVDERINTHKNESERNKLCLKVNYKDIVTIVDNDAIVNTLKVQNYLDTSQLEQIQSCIGQVKKNQKLIDIIWTAETGVYQAFVAALKSAGSYGKLVDKLDGTQEDANINLDALDIDIEGLHNENISHEKRASIEELLKDWQKNDKIFVETRAATKVEELLRTYNYAVVIGGLGFGKTAILRHVALKLCNTENYDIIPKVWSPLEIKEYAHPDRKQIFVVDNIFDDLVDLWSSQLNEISNQLHHSNGKMKLIISCDKHMYTEHFDVKDRQNEPVCDLHNFPLNEKEIAKFVALYIGEKQISDVKDLHSQDEFGVPFLCKLSKGRGIGAITDLFQDPLAYIEGDLTNMHENNKLEFCVLTLITLVDNCFKTEWLHTTQSLPEYLHQALEDICEELDLNYNTDITKMNIKNRFEKPDTIYINKTGNKYHLLHEKVLEIMAMLSSKYFMSTFIQHASESFIRKRCLFTSIEIRPERKTFRIDKKKYEHMYFDRLFKDLEYGNMLSTFHNSQLQFQLYRDKFIKYCKKSESNFRNLLAQLKSSAEDIQADSENVIDDYEYLKWKAKKRRCKQPIIESVWEGWPDIVQLLIDMNCDVNSTDKLNRSALFFAALFGYSEIVELLAKHGGDISICDIMGRSPLYVACDSGHSNVVKCLLNSKADVLKCDNAGRSPLYIACKSHKEIVETLLNYKSKCDLSKADDTGKSPLFFASMSGRSDIVNVLLEHRAEIEQSDNRGFTPLFAAAINGTSQHIKVIETLLNKQANVSHRDRKGRTALLIACEKGLCQLVQILIGCSEELITIRDKEDKSPLFVSCEHGRPEIVKTLIGKKADINQCDEKGRSPLFIACYKGHGDVVDVLLEFKADVNLCDKDGRSSFYIASRGGYVEIMKKLFDHKADVSRDNNWGGSVLNVTCREGHIGAVEFLLKTKANIEKADNNGYTALYVASDQGHKAIVDILLENRANVNVQTHSKMTPLHAACARGHVETAQLLLRHGANRELTNNTDATPMNLAYIKGHTAILNLLQDKTDV